MKNVKEIESPRSFNPFKNDPFLRVTFTWAAGLVGVIMVFTFAALQLDESENLVITGIPFFVVVFGCAYLVKFIGKRPVYYCGLCGFLVGAGLALIGLIGELISGLYWESFIRFLFVAFMRGAPLVFVGMFAGWWVTRGRVPIEIEMPGKQEIEEARKNGRAEPAPRIITPVSAMPGSKTENAAMLKQLEKDPYSLLPEKERQKQTKLQGKNQK
jgi:hypothetical protein